MSYCPTVLRAHEAFNASLEAEVKTSDEDLENRKVDVIGGEEEINQLTRKFFLLSDPSVHNSKSRDGPDLEKGPTIVVEHQQHYLEKALAEARKKESLIGDKKTRIRESSLHVEILRFLYYNVSNV